MNHVADCIREFVAGYLTDQQQLHCWMVVEFCCGAVFGWLGAKLAHRLWRRR